MIKTFVNSYISLHNQKARVIGSYDRNTLISPLSGGDVDIMIILHYGDNETYYNSEGTTKILDKFKYILDKEYPRTIKRRDRNCITMELSEFNLDIVPTFYNNADYYHIPDSIEKVWLDTNPIEFAKKTTQINKAMNNSFVPLIKMVKAWNRVNGNLLNGYHIECIMYHNYKHYTEGYTYDSMLKIFFEKLPYYLQQSCTDPITLKHVDTYLGNSFNDKRQAVVRRANNAKDISSLAFAEAENGDIRNSIELWKTLFGNYFPLYG